MILTVTLNPCIDKSSKVEILKPESKLRCTEVVNEPGGGGINVSKALKKIRNIFGGTLSGRWAQWKHALFSLERRRNFVSCSRYKS